MATDSPQVMALRQRYRQSLTDKSNDLSEFLNQLSKAEQQSSWQLGDEAAHDLGEYLHKLAGSAGMYGYADIAQLARSAMDDNRQSNTVALFERLNELRSLLEQHA